AYVYWPTEGMKTITPPGLTFTILVHPALDASFSLPEEIPGGAKVYLPADAAFEHEWKLEAYRPSFSVWESFGVQTPERIDDQTVALTFHYYTGYTAYRLTHTVTAPYGTDTYSGETSGVTRDYQPEIGIVDIDEASGKYSIHPGQLRNDITDFMVYRETETYNQYELIGTMTNEAFVDMDSSPENHTSRYYVKARFWYGESLAGKAHQPIHAQIGAGINGEWNISWNRYEGRDATTYRVLRGATPDALTCIAEVPGSTTAYTDRNADASTRYYAVETLIAKPTSLRNIAYWRSRSNTVSTDASGLDNVAIDTMETYEVYNTAGILVRSAATRAELEALPAGLYIVNGEKVVIRH
ncbi:MAG: hypothetical protein K2L62_04445, partial [Muribaculaceae bacterium]|nr:hypothetical protein [Muribaculaceae bacterium]